SSKVAHGLRVPLDAALGTRKQERGVFVSIQIRKEQLAATRTTAAMGMITPITRKFGAQTRKPRFAVTPSTDRPFRSANIPKPRQIIAKTKSPRHWVVIFLPSERWN